MSIEHDFVNIKNIEFYTQDLNIIMECFHHYHISHYVAIEENEKWESFVSQ